MVKQISDYTIRICELGRAGAVGRSNNPVDLILAKLDTLTMTSNARQLRFLVLSKAGGYMTRDLHYRTFHS